MKRNKFFLKGADGTEQGPYSVKMLNMLYAEGKLTESDPVRAEEADEWVCYKELASARRETANPSVSPAAEDAAPLNPVTAVPVRREPGDNVKGTKAVSIWLSVVAVIAVIGGMYGLIASICNGAVLYGVLYFLGGVVVCVNLMWMRNLLSYQARKDEWHAIISAQLDELIRETKRQR